MDALTRFYSSTGLDAGFAGHLATITSLILLAIICVVVSRGSRYLIGAAVHKLLQLHVGRHTRQASRLYSAGKFRARSRGVSCRCNCVPASKYGV